MGEKKRTTRPMLFSPLETFPYWRNWIPLTIFFFYEAILSSVYFILQFIFKIKTQLSQKILIEFVCDWFFFSSINLYFDFTSIKSQAAWLRIKAKILELIVMVKWSFFFRFLVKLTKVSINYSVKTKTSNKFGLWGTWSFKYIIQYRSNTSLDAESALQTKVLTIGKHRK